MRFREPIRRTLVTAIVAAFALSCVVQSESERETPTPQPSGNTAMSTFDPSETGFGPPGPSPPPTPPELYIINESRTKEFKARLVQSDWIVIEREEWDPEMKIDWSQVASRGDAKILEFRTEVPPQLSLVGIYFDVDSDTGRAVKEPGVLELDSEIQLQCLGQGVGCFEFDGTYSSRAALPEVPAEVEYIVVFAQWITYPLEPWKKPTVEGNWKIYFKNDDAQNGPAGIIHSTLGFLKRALQQH